MNELRILRGRDIGAAVDGSEIFGLTELTATAKPVYHEVQSRREAYRGSRRQGHK